MSRCAFITSNGDPFVLLHCVHYFETVWESEVDKLYIQINSDIERPVIDTLLKLLEHPKIVIDYVDHCIGFGEPFTRLFKMSTEEKLVFLEDDSIIFRKGILNHYFDLLDKYSLIGSPRMSCSADFAEMVKKEFNLNYEGYGDKGPNFWPCFLFVGRELLSKTNLDFGPSPLGDTFVATSLHLRRLIGDQSKILEIPQYHLSPDDDVNHQLSRGVFDGNCGYFHIGSLSSGIENTILDENNIPLKERTKGMGPINPINPQTDLEEKELEKRVMWWRSAHELSFKKYGDAFDGFDAIYRRGVGDVITRSHLNRQRMNSMKKKYEEVLYADG